jgi:methyl-accepting chemotaxis protein
MQGRFLPGVVVAVNHAGSALNEILVSIKKVAEIVAGIANASAEQATRRCRIASTELNNRAVVRMTKAVISKTFALSDQANRTTAA